MGFYTRQLPSHVLYSRTKCMFFKIWLMTIVEIGNIYSSLSLPLAINFLVFEPHEFT